ncbi:DedA family protein [Lichenibacterium minor]|uniref:DedA family protein n=2 Tax=Lichenibacterium minor TaxID=2316528 RepID=A0A4Q2U5L8_9HYPH|nr:DedA family protein [Lichenibacterium minor]RYC31610.1 DedA family protein [Lichenibacterium minor]
MAWIAQWGQGIVGFVRDHEAWAAPICFALAFGESLAFVSFLLPATLVLVAVGGLVGQAGLAFLPVFVAAAVGAALGDWLSFWLGRHFEDRVAGLWPLSRHPGMLVRARSYIDRWGAVGVFLGRFLGPLRATVPLIAGLAAMPALPFQAANWTSALVWAFLVLAPGAFGVDAVRGWFA